MFNGCASDGVIVKFLSLRKKNINFKSDKGGARERIQSHLKYPTGTAHEGSKGVAALAPVD